MDKPIWERRASRVLLLDPQRRVLLFRGCDPANPQRKYWFTAGGGIDPGEDPRAAASRELREETGMRVAPETFGEPVHRDSTEFDFDGYRVHQQQIFYLLRVSDTAVDTSGFEAVERATMDEYRWWSGEELRTTGEEIYPEGLCELLEAL